MSHWRKIGKAYRLSDDYWTLWIRRIGRRFHLMHHQTDEPADWRTHGSEVGWVTLGVHDTLREAQADGSALMGYEEEMEA